MKRPSSQYPRYGYRRIRIFLRREGLTMSVSRAERLWRKAGLQLPRKRPRRRIAPSRPRPLPPRAANHATLHARDACGFNADAPRVFDVRLLAMSPQAFTLAGFERIDGVEYAQSWLVG